MNVGKEDKRGDMLNIHLLHTALMSTVFVDNGSSIPFLVCPVGNENLAVASEHGVTIMGWTYDETDSSLICSLMDLDMVALSKSVIISIHVIFFVFIVTKCNII